MFINLYIARHTYHFFWFTPAVWQLLLNEYVNVMLSKSVQYRPSLAGWSPAEYCPVAGGTVYVVKYSGLEVDADVFQHFHW